MTKYKIVGIFNLIVGILQLLFSVIGFFLVSPQMNQLTTGIGSKPTNNNLQYFLGFVFGIINLVLFKKLFSTTLGERYLIIGLVFSIMTFLFLGVLIGVSMSQMLTPLYNLPK